MPFCGISRCDWLCYCRFCSFSHVRYAVFWPLFGAKVGINNPTNKIFYHFFRIFLWFFRPKLFCLAERKPQIAENVHIASPATFRHPDCHFLAVSRKCDEDERVREEEWPRRPERQARQARPRSARGGGAASDGRGRNGEGAPWAPSRRQGHKKKSSSAKELLCCRPQAVDYSALYSTFGQLWFET